MGKDGALYLSLFSISLNLRPIQGIYKYLACTGKKVATKRCASRVARRAKGCVKQFRREKFLRLVNKAARAIPKQDLPRGFWAAAGWRSIRFPTSLSQQGWRGEKKEKPAGPGRALLDFVAPKA